MQHKQILSAGLCLMSLLILSSCTQEPVSPNASLQLSDGMVHVGHLRGSSVQVTVQSTIAWKLSFAGTAPAWLCVNKTSGTGTQPILFTTTDDNIDGKYRAATVVVSPADNSQLPQQRLTVVQTDTAVGQAHQ